MVIIGVNMAKVIHGQQVECLIWESSGISGSSDITIQGPSFLNSWLVCCTVHAGAGEVLC